MLVLVEMVVVRARTRVRERVISGNVMEEGWSLASYAVDTTHQQEDINDPRRRSMHQH